MTCGAKILFINIKNISNSEFLRQNFKEALKGLSQSVDL